MMLSSNRWKNTMTGKKWEVYNQQGICIISFDSKQMADAYAKNINGTVHMAH
jgi:hypothetical protein